MYHCTKEHANNALGGDTPDGVSATHISKKKVYDQISQICMVVAWNVFICV